jgi:hypothetical protein
MAKTIESGQTKWAKVTETVQMEDSGDILYPLRKVQVEYYIRALRHEGAGRIQQAAYYHEQVKNVGRLINA